MNKDLNTKPDNLCKTNVTHKHVNNKTQSKNTFHTYVRNIWDVTFDNEETLILEFGFNCNFKENQWNFVLIIDTDNAITLHNTYNFLTHKKVRQITVSNTANNILRKRQSE